MDIFVGMGYVKNTEIGNFSELEDSCFNLNVWRLVYNDVRAGSKSMRAKEDFMYLSGRFFQMIFCSVFRFMIS